MASTITNNPVTMNASSDRGGNNKRKKKKSTMMIKENHNQRQQQSHVKWRSETQQRIYSSKLLHALSRVSLDNNNNDRSSSASRGGLAVREAADTALAVAAKGRTRWSRAILTSRLKLKFRKRKRQRGSIAVTGNSRLLKKSKFSVSKLRGRSLPAVQRKVKILGRLVPGCRKEPLPVILEEATDYIAALEMQIRAMSTLADLLSGSGAASSSAAPPTPLSPPPLPTSQ